jgi:hypothetical protein
MTIGRLECVVLLHHGDDQAAQLGDEARQRLQGVLLRARVCDKPYSEGETPHFLSLFGCGYAALGTDREASAGGMPDQNEFRSRNARNGRPIDRRELRERQHQRLCTLAAVPLGLDGPIELFGQSQSRQADLHPA